MPRYRRLVIKLSGQAIAGSAQFGFNTDSLTRLAHEVIDVHDTGDHNTAVGVAVIVGGGNIFRGNQPRPGVSTGSRPTTSACSAP